MKTNQNRNLRLERPILLYQKAISLLVLYVMYIRQEGSLFRVMDSMELAGLGEDLSLFIYLDR